MTCEHCNDSGKTVGSDFLDCGYCDTARERADLEAWAHHQAMTTTMRPFDLYWAIYQRGKKAGAPM